MVVPTRAVGIDGTETAAPVSDLESEMRACARSGALVWVGVGGALGVWGVFLRTGREEEKVGARVGL